MTSQESNSDYKYIFELEKKQEIAWNLIVIRWQEAVFYPYVKKSKIELSDCQKCGSLYLDIECNVDANGKMTIDASYAKKCGKKMDEKLENYLLNYFISEIFPENLRNLKIKHRFGVLYKC